jgi:hypothetical protein
MVMEVIRQALRREPFQPFLLRLTDGRALLVPRVGSLAVTPGRVLFVSPVDDSISIIPAGEIRAVECWEGDRSATQHRLRQGLSVGNSSIEEKWMQINAIREALHKQPFQPFTLRLADGRGLPVPHPDFVAILGRTAVVASPHLDDSYSIVEPLLIVSIEYSAAQPASGTSTGGNS